MTKYILLVDDDALLRITLGLLAQAGYRLLFGRFMRDSIPVTVITLLLASIWLLLRYL